MNEAAIAARGLAATLERHQFGNATEAELDAAWNRLLIFYLQPAEKGAPADGLR